MTLKENINDQVKSAMKDKDAESLSVLRMLQAKIKDEEINTGKRDEGLNDEEVLAVISKQVKQRKDSIEQFTKGGRDDLAQKEKEELALLETFLPEQMGEEDIKKIVEKIVSSGATDFGAVMGQVMGKLKGQADGGVVKKVVEETLT